MYTLARAVLWPIAKLLFRVSFEGRGNVPKTGPLIIVANHASYADPILVGLAVRRPIHFMAKSELWSVPVLRWFITKLNSFPVRRGTADRQVIRTALELLAAGEIVLLFPEARRIREGAFGPIQPGAGVIAEKAKVPIVPVAVAGSRRIWPPGARLPRLPKLSVAIGEPIPPEPERGEAPEAKRKGISLLRRAMGQIEKMLEESRDSSYSFDHGERGPLRQESGLETGNLSRGPR